MTATRLRVIGAAVIALAVAGGAAAAGSNGEAHATLHDRQGKEVGQVLLRASPHGVLLDVSLDGVPPGRHALHIHTTGKCEPPFASAGGHFDDDAHAHGFLAAGGPHAGDLPNVIVPASGKLEVEVFDGRAHLDDGARRLLDADGAAIVIHEGPDDYVTDPAGAAGPRIACGVIASGS